MKNKRHCSIGSIADFRGECNENTHVASIVFIESIQVNIVLVQNVENKKFSRQMCLVHSQIHFFKFLTLACSYF